MKALIAIAALACAPAAVADIPSIDDIEFSSFETDGSACEGDNLFANIVAEDDNQNADVLDFAFLDVAAKTGPKQKKSAFQKSCTMNFVMTYPKGYRFSFDYVTFTGYADIKTGQLGKFTTHVAPITNTSGSASGYTTYLIGPVKGEFDGGRTMREIKRFKTPCSGKVSMYVRTSVGIDGKTKAAGTISSSRKNGYMNQSFKINWEKC